MKIKEQNIEPKHRVKRSPEESLVKNLHKQTFSIQIFIKFAIDVVVVRYKAFAVISKCRKRFTVKGIDWFWTKTYQSTFRSDASANNRRGNQNWKRDKLANSHKNICYRALWYHKTTIAMTKGWPRLAASLVEITL